MPARLYPVGLVLHPVAGAADAIAKPPNGICPWGWIASGSACEMDARGSSLRAGSIFQSPEFRTPPCLTVGATVDQCTSAHAQPGDKVVGAWPRDRLVAMDATFCARVERTIAAGDESPQGSLPVAAIPAHVAKGTMTR